MRTVAALLVLVSLVPAQHTTGPGKTVADGGWKLLFNGKDLAGWHGERSISPYDRAAMSPEKREAFIAKGSESVKKHWRVENRELINDGQGAFLTTDREYGDADFEIQYRTVAKADSGIYLRGCPQVQIWDYTKEGGKWGSGADKGSGALWNNKKHERFPPKLADKPFGEWNTLMIRILGERVWVKLNGITTVDGVVFENYWDRSRPLPAKGPLQLQTHGGEIRFRNLRVREIEPTEATRLLRSSLGAGYERVFDGESFAGWKGAVNDYEIHEGALRCKPGKGGNLFTEGVYDDFRVQFEFRLPPGGNNGLAMRYPGTGNPANAGFELQVLDNTALKYRNLKPWQFHGSVYGVEPSHRGYQRALGEWNFQEVIMKGSHVTVILNGTCILDTDLAGRTSNLTGHTGLHRTEGHFGFCGHNDPVEFREIRIKRLSDEDGK